MLMDKDELHYFCIHLGKCTIAVTLNKTLSFLKKTGSVKIISSSTPYLISCDIFVHTASYLTTILIG